MMEKQIKQNPTLAGQRVIIMGGSSGIGLATARASAVDGAQVVIVSSNQKRIYEALSTLPDGSRGYAVDLSSEADIKNFFGQVGRFDHLVYSAGENLSLSMIADTDLEAARRFWNVRYWGAYASVKYGALYINTGGSISLTGGTAGARPMSSWTTAASICCAIEGLTRALAVELAPIRVNVVVPGLVNTNLWNGMPEADKETLFATFGNTLPVKRVGEANDIAQTYLYLMKQQYGTGQHIVVDGGGSLV